MSLVFLILFSIFLFILLPGNTETLDVHYSNLNTINHEKYFDLIKSFHSLSRPDLSVWSILKEIYSETLILIFAALFGIYIATFFFGIIYINLSTESVKKTYNSLLNQINNLPTFIVAPLAYYFFCIKLQIFPSINDGSIRYYVLPVLVIALKPAVLLALMLLIEIDQTSQQNFITYARAKGLSRLQIQFKYILRNSVLSLVSTIPSLVTSLVSGSIIVEIFFSIPGTGSEVLTSVSQRDYTVLTGIVITVGIMIILLTEFSSWLCRKLFPQLKLR